MASVSGWGFQLKKFPVRHSNGMRISRSLFSTSSESSETHPLPISNLSNLLSLSISDLRHHSKSRVNGEVDGKYYNGKRNLELERRVIRMPEPAED